MPAPIYSLTHEKLLVTKLCSQEEFDGQEDLCKSMLIQKGSAVFTFCKLWTWPCKELIRVQGKIAGTPDPVHLPFTLADLTQGLLCTGFCAVSALCLRTHPLSQVGCEPISYALPESNRLDSQHRLCYAQTQSIFMKRYPCSLPG